MKRRNAVKKMSANQSGRKRCFSSVEQQMSFFAGDQFLLCWQFRQFGLAKRAFYRDSQFRLYQQYLAESGCNDEWSPVLVCPIFCLPGKKTRHVKASGYFGEREGYAGEFGIKYKF